MVSYSAEDFVKELTSDEGLSLPTPSVVRIGLVDPAQSDSEKISFAPGIQCSIWREVHLDRIDRVDYLGTQPCGQQEYPYVRLHLTPTTDEERVFAEAPQPETAPVSTTPPPTMPVSPTPPASRYAAPTGRSTPFVSRHQDPTLPMLPRHLRGCS
jgi:hypothetical protein